MSGREREREVVSRADRYPVCIPVRCTLSLSLSLFITRTPSHTHTVRTAHILCLSLSLVAKITAVPQYSVDTSQRSYFKSRRVGGVGLGSNPGLTLF